MVIWTVFQEDQTVDEKISLYDTILFNKWKSNDKIGIPLASNPWQINGSGQYSPMDNNILERW